MFYVNINSLQVHSIQYSKSMTFAIKLMLSTVQYRIIDTWLLLTLFASIHWMYKSPALSYSKYSYRSVAVLGSSYLCDAQHACNVPARFWFQKQDWKVFQPHRLHNKWQIFEIFDILCLTTALSDNYLMTAWRLPDDCLTTAGQLSDNHWVSTTVWQPLCANHCVRTTLWWPLTTIVCWPLCDDHCVTTICDNHCECVMTTVLQPLLADPTSPNFLDSVYKKSPPQNITKRTLSVMAILVVEFSSRDTKSERFLA